MLICKESDMGWLYLRRKLCVCACVRACTYTRMYPSECVGLQVFLKSCHHISLGKVSN